jgi:hypothetical protein
MLSLRYTFSPRGVPKGWATNLDEVDFPREPEVYRRKNDSAPWVKPCGKPGILLLQTLRRKGQKKFN